MRKNVVAGNWKMNKTLAEGVQLATEINAAVKAAGTIRCDVIVAPPFVHLTEVCKAAGDRISVAAQNCASEAAGAYTGEVSAAMIKSAGVSCVIIGHSERRTYYGETNAVLSKKVEQALANGLKPIFCIGEELAQRDSGKYFDVVYSQLQEGLFNLSADDFKKIIIAYEPVWAIGTGRTATAEQAQEVHAYIRKSIAAKYGEDTANGIAILYGGSCNENNAKELFACRDIDGGLIGGASLSADKFIKIITSF